MTTLRKYCEIVCRSLMRTTTPSISFFGFCLLFISSTNQLVPANKTRNEMPNLISFQITSSQQYKRTDIGLLKLTMNDTSSQQGNYSFQLNDFDTYSSSLLRGIRYETDFKDVSLACEGGKVSAHKVILSGCSSMFKSILQKNPHPHPFIYFKGVNLCDLRALLDFIYKGECRVPRDRITAFLSLAEELNVNGLSEEAEQSSISKEPTSHENNNMNFDEDDNNEEPCDDTIPDEVMLLANISEEMGPEGKTFKCDLCSKILKKKYNMLCHIEGKHFPGMFRYECQQCGKKFNSRKDLHSHSKYRRNRCDA